MTDAFAEKYARVHNLHVTAVMDEVLHPKHPAIQFYGSDNSGSDVELVVVGSYDELDALADLIKKLLKAERAAAAADFVERMNAALDHAGKVPVGSSNRYVPSGYVLVYEDREDRGPDIVGPFDTREVAVAHAESLQIESHFHVQRLMLPALLRPTSQPVVNGPSDETAPARGQS